MATTNLILLTLIPTAPRDPTKFSGDIKDLDIKVHDLTVKDSLKGVKIGEASGLLPYPYVQGITIIPATTSPPHPAKLKTSIIQHFYEVPIVPPPAPPALPFVPTPYSVATAVVVVDFDEAKHSEYDTYDLKITITRGGQPLGKPLPSLQFNVPNNLVTGALPQDPMLYTSGSQFTSACYVQIPPLPDIPPSTPAIEISADGVTPVFDSLVTAVNAVLAADHTSTGTGPTSLQTRATPLTAPQSLQVARELVYDRGVYPLPTPKSGDTVEGYYSNPNVSTSDDQDRKQFEADLSSYYSTHDAEAIQLSNFVYAAGAAIQCERLSLTATSALLTFDVVAGPLGPNESYDTAGVIVQGVPIPSNKEGYLAPTFGVPAAFFYALGYSMPNSLSVEDRQTSSSVKSEKTILKGLTAAQDSGILADTESALTSTDALVTGLNVQQAARRLVALGGTSGITTFANLDSKIFDVVKDWLIWPGDSDAIGTFWASESTSQPAEYLELVLDVVVAEVTALKDAIRAAPLSVTTVVQLAAVTDNQWRGFFLPAATSATDPLPAERAALLPAYTEPGTPAQRVNAFIRFLKKLFAVQQDQNNQQPQDANTVPVLEIPTQDCLSLFFSASPGFTFAAKLDITTVQNTIATLPLDDRRQKWTLAALETLSFLWTVTTLASPNKQTQQQQFSLMEALYARGFISANRVALLSQSQFNAALAGTIAFTPAIANAIYALATPLATVQPDLGPEPGTTFTPINPGTLVDCVPPPNLSPLGPVAYLSDLLAASIASTSTSQSSGTTTVTLAVALGTRRGPLGNLAASLANLETAIPALDIVNESLEALVADVSTSVTALQGVVNNTDDTAVLGIKLHIGEGEDEESKKHGEKELNAEKALAAIPQYSSPGFVPNPAAAAYQALAQDFSAPDLPYSQELDITRSYLETAGSSRFEVERRWRQVITEWAVDPINEPADFQTNLWRFPVALDVAAEYLCLSPAELALFQTGVSGAALQNIYGFASGTEEWAVQLISLPVFLARTGMSYCEFRALAASGLVSLGAAVGQGDGRRLLPGGFPACEPCCLSSYYIAFPDETEQAAEATLALLAVFIRLWRKVEARYGCFDPGVLVQICNVLQLFNGTTINPDFIRQFVALLMLCDYFCLPLCEKQISGGQSSDSESQPSPQQLVPILALWTSGTNTPQQDKWAAEKLLDGVEHFAIAEHSCPRRTAEFKKIIVANLPALSKLTGFPDSTPWDAKPTCTLRFAEMLAKVYASDFTVGEVLFLFTDEHHLRGDDPFPTPSKSEALDDPLELPDDDAEHGLWALRRELLEACVDDREAETWTWRRIESCLHDEFGLGSPASSGNNTPGSDPLTQLGEHFFPSTLEAAGHVVPLSQRRFSTPLAASATTTSVWEAPPCQPFHYSTSSAQLWAELPLRDESVLKKLAHTRQLNPAEARAVQNLYNAPRATLAPLTAVFGGNLAEAADHLVQEASEQRRFAYFRRSFALFKKRCDVVARHVAKHVDSLACGDGDDCERPQCCDEGVAKRVIASLLADENRARVPWERDDGTPPAAAEFLWDPRIGTAFAALLGLAGTGLLGTYKLAPQGHQGRQQGQQGPVTWEEVRGPLCAFGPWLDDRNVPVPTVLPALIAAAGQQQGDGLVVRNGFALDDESGRDLGGAQAFSVEWKGVLLVEKRGHYHFLAERPEWHERHHHHKDCDEECGEEDCEKHHGEHHHGEHHHGEHHGEKEHHEHGKEQHKKHCKFCDEARWIVRLRRGQKVWTLLNHKWESDEKAPADKSLPVCLARGAYDIEVGYEQTQPEFKSGQGSGSSNGDSTPPSTPSTGQSLATSSQSRFFQGGVSHGESSQEAEPEEERHHLHTGFGVKYCGPDTGDEAVYIPFNKLFLKRKDQPLAAGNPDKDSEIQTTAQQLLKNQYVSSLRDIRRTYQRAFKAVMFAHKFCLSEEAVHHCDGEAELAFLLGHPVNFQGTSTYPGPAPSIASDKEKEKAATAAFTTTWKTHHANFDFNFLPVRDPYFPPDATQDDRVSPSPQRMSALFDWFERTFDYKKLAREVRRSFEDEDRHSPGPVWRLFYEAAEQAPADATTLVRHLGVDMGLAPLVTKFFQNYTVAVTDLADERWAIRVWRAWLAVERMRKATSSREWIKARPALWAAPSPSTAVDPSDATPQSGLQNLVALVVKAALLGRDPPGFDFVKNLNDGLRLRANKALIAYLLALNRVALPFTSANSTASSPQDLTAFLLQEVDVGPCDTTTRVEQAICSIQTFVQRVKLGLESQYALPPGFNRKWDAVLATFGTWRAAARRHLYSENWIQWEELDNARNSEAFRFLERGLAVHEISLPDESAPFATTGSLQIPGPGAFPDLQSARLGVLTEMVGAPDEGVDLLGTPARDGQPSWLAPQYLASTTTPGSSTSGGGNGGTAGTGGSGSGNGGSGTGTGTVSTPKLRKTLLPVPTDQVNIPMWFQAAVRMGTTFIRLAAAGLPPALTSSLNDTDGASSPQQCFCGKAHAPVMDEYYFWLDQGKYFDDSLAPQDATAGVVPPDPTTDWERSNKAPALLHWPASSLVYLRWTRVHYGEFGPPRRSPEGAPFDADSESPSIVFNGRNLDSLMFGPVGGLGIGFRYDIATDSAMLDPQPVTQAFPTMTYPAPFLSYPFFVYFQPGAPIAPASSFGTVLSIAGSLRAQCKFEQALAWCRVAFDPLSRQNSWPQCQKTLETSTDKKALPEKADPKQPEPQTATAPAAAATTTPSTAATGSSTATAKSTAPLSTTAATTTTTTTAARAQPVSVLDGPCCPTSPVKPGIGRARAVVLEYIQILLQWGDSLFCRGTAEARSQALVLYSEAIRLLGPKPAVINAKDAALSSQMTVSSFTAAPAPLNARLLDLYQVAYDRRDLVQRGLNPRRLKTIAGRGWEGAGKGGCCSGSGSGSFSEWSDDGNACQCWMPEYGLSPGGLYQCCLPYKFAFLLPKALDLVGVVKGLGGQLLSALEKNDSEYLAALRQSHETQMTELVLVTKQNAWREADWQVQALDSQMQGAQQRLRYNQGLINAGLNSGENGYLSGTQISMTSRTAGSITEGVGQGMNFIPDFTVGGAGAMASPVAITQLPLGTKLAAVFQAASRILGIVADVAGTTAGVGNTTGGWQRRSDEWAHQVDIITIELEQIKQQQLAAERRRDMALRDLNNQQVQIEHSAEVDAFMADKLSKQDLYLFLQQETAGLYRRSYDLAWQTAREAQASLQHERRDLTALVAQSLPPELGPGAWDNLHEGLTAGERLEVALRGLERMYLRETGCREYELTKHISLRLQAPLAFLQLKTLGWCELELPEWSFDLDYPGHYLRRIKNLSVTIPCVVGPYVGVHCRVQLLSSGLRLEPTLPMRGKCCCKKGNPCIGPKPKDNCHGPRRPACGREEDDRHCETRYAHPGCLSRDFLTTEAIATSTGQNDSGLFELSFHDEKLRAPFEFAGAAASRWRIELPPEQNAFDLESLADLVLHLSYTAREGGPALRDVAERAARRRLPGDGVRFFDVRNEFPGEWGRVFGAGKPHGEEKRGQKWKNKGQGRHQHEGPRHRERVFPLRFSRRSFPFLTGRRAVIITGLHVFVDADAPGEVGEHFSAEFVPEEGCGDAGKKAVVCTSAGECDGLYQGVLGGVRLGPLWEDEGRVLGHLKFPESLGRARVRQVYFLCSYEAVERP